jgi:homospermidine synthase
MTKKFHFKGRILMLGYGSVGRCTLPLIDRHFDMPLSHIAIVDADDSHRHLSSYIARGLKYESTPVVRENMAAVLAKYLGKGDLLINLAVEVSSIELMNWCQAHGVLYTDTCIEPWAGYYDNAAIPAHERSNYFLRYNAIENAKKWRKGSPSALLTHGANPGLITHFIKQALLDIAKMRGLSATKPKTQRGWARLMMKTGTKVIHVAEHDTQISSDPKKPGEFVNTWSVPGFVGEGLQPAELGWGTHEKRLPQDGNEHPVGPKCAIYLNQPGCVTQVRSWTPIGGPMIGFLITHGESISTSDYFTVWEDGRATYRPTCHYSYHCCNDAVLSVRELQMNGFHIQKTHRILGREITQGIDELGALLMGDFGAYWYGSQLSIEEARELLGPEFNATSIQVAAPVLAGCMYLIENPTLGLLEPEDLDHDYVLDICRPYLGPVVGVHSDWTPLQDRGRLFEEPNVDWDDPWQFRNFRVS